MPAAVFVHPHPDDEAIFTGGSMRRASDAGWRVILVLATGGEEGAMPDWVTLDAADHRRMETAAAAEILGVAELHYLGYRDSGMAGERTNASAGSLASSVAAATDDLVALLGRQPVDCVVGQDAHGIYGHPDHIAVHHVVAEAAQRTPVPELLEATLDRDWLLTLRHDRIASGRLDPAAWCPFSLAEIGVSQTDTDRAAAVTGPAGTLVHVEVTPERDAKQAAMAAHASQVPDAIDFMGIPPGLFHQVVEHEWFLRAHNAPGLLERLLTSC